MTPFGTRSSLLIKIATACLLVLVAMWVRLFVLIDNNYSDAINRAEQRVLSKSQIFAEYTLATIKRVDQISREARSDWEDDPAHFERFVSQQSRFGSDFAIQIAVIAKTGILVYSSLGPVTDRLICFDLSILRFDFIFVIDVQCVGSRTNSLPTVDQSDMRGLVTA